MVFVFSAMGLSYYNVFLPRVKSFPGMRSLEFDHGGTEADPQVAVVFRIDPQVAGIEGPVQGEAVEA
jgi:hypothetical protein